MTQKKITSLDIRNRKGTDRKIVMLTAYDYPIARLAEMAGVDMVLVSDALGMVGLGCNTTISVTMDQIVHHTKAVVRGTRNCLVVSTMPFLSFGCSAQSTLENAGRLIKEAGADAVEVEGGPEVLETVKLLLDAGISVIPHIGLTRQHLTKFGSFKVLGKNAEQALEIFALALSLQDPGIPAIILECIPDRLARLITKHSEVPTIGVGAGPHCDGQSLVSQDLLGLFERFVPKFVKRYLNLSEDIHKAFDNFAEDVRSGRFPTAEYSFSITDQEFERLEQLITRAKMT